MDMRACHLLLLLVAAAAADTVHVAVGQLFSLRLAASDSLPRDGLPNWMGFDGDQNTLYGVPLWGRMENVTLLTTQGNSIEVNTHIEFEQCPIKKEYITVEKFENKDLADYGVADLKKEIEAFAETFKIEASAVRAYKVSDLKKYRKADDFLISPSADFNPRDSMLVLWTKVVCGNLDSITDDTKYNTMLETASELDREQPHIQLGQAYVLTEKILAFQTATPSPVARTTRRVHDAPPNVYNRISKFECYRGVLCHKWLPANTFIDSEDGNLINLRSDVFSTDQHPNFLTIARGVDTIALEGIPLRNGSFEFRLEVRDSRNQVANAAFSVEVKPHPEPNHLFELVLDTKAKKFEEKPKLLVDFANKIAQRLHANANDVLVDSVEDQGARTLLRWSNKSLSRSTCEEKQINGTKSLLTGKTQRIREFAKHMGADFAVRDINVKLQGNCVPQDVTPQVVPTTEATPLEEESGISNTILLILIVAAVILLTAILVVIFCCVKRKPAPKKNQEYTTKGTPIVFPDDVQQDDDNNGATAAATTPMLVSHEHPPLNPQKATTLHENPLYKPPAADQGTPSRAVAGQRLPPPYVAP